MKVQLLQENCKKNKISVKHLWHLQIQVIWDVILRHWAGRLDPEDEGIIILQNIGKICIQQHSMISQKTGIISNTTGRT
jgi:hypothetical protein